EVPGRGRRRHREVEEGQQLLEMSGIGHSNERLDPSVEVAMHHIGAADEHLRVAVAMEREDAGVLQVAPEDAPHRDVVADPGEVGAQAADAAHPHVHRHPGLARAVQGVDDLLVDHRVDLDADVRGLALQRVLPLFLDLAEQTFPQVQRCDQQTLELLLDRVARELVEQAREVFADLRVGGEEAEVLVDATGLRVVVAGADVGVVAEGPLLLADHESEFAVGLEPDETVDDVDAGLLELAGPDDVVRLVEARLDLHQGEHLLARLGGVDQRLHDRAVAGGAVQGLLDREHVRVACGLLQERLHARRERLVGVVHEHVGLADGFEDVGAFVVVARLEGHGRGGQVRLVVQVGPVDPGQVEEAAEVERAGEPVDLLVRDVELLQEQVEGDVVHVVGDLQADRWAEPSPEQLRLQRLDEVLRLVLLDLDVFVARETEGVVIEHLHAGE
ncbi:hypothetical protein ABE10_01425, partial [Bacillus toyonensis]|nr:hypothetical protein [Bacillus toyonensis]